MCNTIKWVNMFAKKKKLKYNKIQRMIWKQFKTVVII